MEIDLFLLGGLRTHPSFLARNTQLRGGTDVKVYNSTPNSAEVQTEEPNRSVEPIERFGRTRVQNSVIRQAVHIWVQRVTER